MDELIILSNEQKLVITASRVTFSKKDEADLLAITKEKINWYDVYKYATKNKVLPLMWKNLCNRNLEGSVPPHLRQVFQFFYLGIHNRSKHFIKEASKILTTMSQNNIVCTPLKGSYLIPNIFQDYGIRGMNDIDCMVKRSDSSKIIKVMNSMGYMQGTLDLKNKVVNPFTREQEILWKSKMSNLAAFYKINKSGYHEFTKFDFTISLDLDLKYELVDIMLERSIKDKKSDYYILKKSDFFIHLCCHLYKEATNATFIVFHKDLNLIKFCDIREFILQKMDKDSVLEAVEDSKKLGLEKALYYTLYYLREIYSDGYETPLLNSMNIEDVSFMNKFNNREEGTQTTWKKSFWERLFSEDNEDELDDRPKFFNVFSVEHAMKNI